jgi:hypothetical protein
MGLKRLNLNGYLYTRWFKCDRDCLCVNKSQFVYRKVLKCGVGEGWRRSV